MAMVTPVALPDGDDGEAVAVADTSPRNVFYDPSAGGVPGCVALEFMAQAMATAVGAIRAARGLPPKVVFVLGARRLVVGIDVFRPDAVYHAHASCAFSDEEFASFNCRISDPGGNTVASASLTAYQPPEN